MSYARTEVISRFVADPEVKGYCNEGGQLARFRVAANITKDKTAFYNCVAFNKTAEIIQKYCTKGKQVFLEGAFHNNDYQKEVGGETITMYGMELVVNRVVLLGDAQGGGQAQSRPSQPAAQTQGGFAQNTQQSQPQGGFSGGGFTGFSEDNLPF